MDDKTHLSDRDLVPFSTPAAPWSPSPGKRSMTQSLMPRPVIYRVENPAAVGPRDGNGVAAHAEVAVDRAAASAGVALPTGVQRQFEASLGADLSSVRVHTGADSQAAAAAVGAQAYTVSQDIHFGAGRYQPDDPFGLHLLAHEVAHTVQQAGGAPHRQHKLAVSGPADAAEVEADRAADAMVRAAPAAIRGASTAIARAPDPVVLDEVDVAYSREPVVLDEVDVPYGGDPIRLDEVDVPYRGDTVVLDDQPVGYHEPDDLVFADEETTASTEMRARGERNVAAFRPAAQADRGTTRVDQQCAQSMIGSIEQAQGPLGMLQGRENAINNEPPASKAYLDRDNPDGKTFQFSQGATCIADNMKAMDALRQFSTSAARQDFQHTFFAESYRQLNEDFLRLAGTIDVLKERELSVTGADAHEDVMAESAADPVLGARLGELRAAADDLRGSAADAGAGISALASKAGAAFSSLTVETEAMRDLPRPKLEETKDQLAADEQIAAIQADLAAATAAIGTFKKVALAAFAVATNDLGAKALGTLGSKTAGYLDKVAADHDPLDGHGPLILPQLDGRMVDRPSWAGHGASDISAPPRDAATSALDAGTDAASDELTGAMASWLTSYNSRIAAATGKAASLSELTKHKYDNIAVSRVANAQAELTDAVAQLALKKQQVQEKKRALALAARQVEAAAKQPGRKHGTDVGAVAQAYAAVATFRTQAQTTRQLGVQEQEQAEQAAQARKSTSGDYIPSQTSGEGDFTTRIAQTNSSEHVYHTCDRSPDADQRGFGDLTGYQINHHVIMFVVTAEDHAERSVTMEGDTAARLATIDKMLVDADSFEWKLEQVLTPDAAR